MNYKIRSLGDINLNNKEIILRVDFNTPQDKLTGEITDSTRIEKSLITIKEIIKQKPARIIILSHLGRIKNDNDKKFLTLKFAAKKLAKLLNEKIIFVPDLRDKDLLAKMKKLQNGEIILFENTRFADYSENVGSINLESGADEQLSQYWAQFGNVFINDAFGLVHRCHTSNCKIVKYINGPSLIGRLIEKELEGLSKITNKPKKPFFALIGGAKVSDKLTIIKKLITKTDKMFIGGGMAYTFLKAKGFKIGKSLYEENQVEAALEILKNNKDKIILPIDHKCSRKYADDQPFITSDTNIPEDMMGLDIGPKTLEMMKDALQNAQTIFWNGPFGVTEFSNYADGTNSISRLISQMDVIKIIAGGDSVAAFNKLNIPTNEKLIISTGGGASMKVIEGEILPALKVLSDINNEETKEEILNTETVNILSSFQKNNNNIELDNNRNINEANSTKKISIFKKFWNWIKKNR